MFNLIKRKLFTNWELILILTVLFLAVFLRFYRLPEYMTFLGDEGRDAIIIKRLLVEHDLPFIGPPTSVGNMYLGPLYYYMMAIPMAIFWLNPVSAAAMVAVIGAVTVFLIYYLAKRWFGNLGALVAAFLYAISPVNIIYSRSSWNPNPAPFFALLAMFGLFTARSSRNFRWFILVGAALAFVVQMHYLAFILLPIFGLFWLYELRGQIKENKYRYFKSGTVIAVITFLLLMSPLALFDLRHNFMNFRAISAFFSQRETTVNLNAANSISRTLPLYQDKLVGRYLTAENEVATPVIALLIILASFISIKVVKNRDNRWPYLALGLWLGAGIVGLSLYKQNVYDHYLGFINPIPFLLVGALVGFFKRKKGIVVAIVLVSVLGYLNFQKSPLRSSPNDQLSRTQKIAQFVISQSSNKPFNFALLAEHNYDAAYQYYLDIYRHKPKVAPLEITDQLFVVCEDKVCNPINHPKYEIAAFGWAKIEKEEDFNGVKVFKLIPNPSGKLSEVE